MYFEMALKVRPVKLQRQWFGPTTDLQGCLQPPIRVETCPPWLGHQRQESCHHRDRSGWTAQESRFQLRWRNFRQNKKWSNKIGPRGRSQKEHVTSLSDQNKNYQCQTTICENNHLRNRTSTHPTSLVQLKQELSKQTTLKKKVRDVFMAMMPCYFHYLMAVWTFYETLIFCIIKILNYTCDLEWRIPILSQRFTDLNLIFQGLLIIVMALRTLLTRTSILNSAIQNVRKSSSKLRTVVPTRYAQLRNYFVRDYFSWTPSSYE